MDAAGIRALLALHDRCPHPRCTFQIEALSEPVERVLRITGTYDRLMEIRAPRARNGDGQQTGLRSPASAMESGTAPAP